MKINYPLLALVVGAFGTKIAEFSPMGLLLAIARSMNVSIPATGMLTSAYTVGVMVGTSLMTPLLSRRARRSASISPITIFTPSNVLSAIAPGYMTLMLSRILTNLNHGAFFGSGSVVTAGVVPKYKQASAVATMLVGLTLINTGGMPAVTWLGETIGWRMSFLATAGLGVIPIVSLFSSLPKGGVRARPEVKKELAVLMRPWVLSVLLTMVLGADAMFVFYTYILPVLRSITHTTPVFVTTMLALIDVGSSIGNHLGGKLADRSVNGTLEGFLLLLMVIMLAILFLARNESGAAISMAVQGAATSAVVSPLQMRVMRVASEAPDLSPSVNTGAFNLGNALGTAASSAVISAGPGYSFAPAVGAIAAGLVLLLAFMSTRKQPGTVCVANS